MPDSPKINSAIFKLPLNIRNKLLNTNLFPPKMKEEEPCLVCNKENLDPEMRLLKWITEVRCDCLY